METTVLERIREVINRLSLSDKKFAEYIGVPQTTLSSLFQRGNEPNVAIVQSILSSFPNISMGWLLFGHGDMFVIKRGEKLKEVRELLGYSMKELAHKLGVQEDFYMRMESGEIPLKENYRDILIRYLGAPADIVPENSEENQLFLEDMLTASELVMNKAVSKIIGEEYESANADYILAGRGAPMEVTEIYHPKYTEKKGDGSIMLYDIEAAANLNSLLANKDQNIIGEIHIPNIPKCDGALYVRGDSMYPLLKSGDIVAYKQIPLEMQQIIFGEMYLVSMDMEGDEYLSIKYVNQSDKGEDWIKLVSYNQHHQAKDFPLSAIRAMALVKLSIRMNTMK